MAWTSRLTQLNDALADLVPREEGITKFVKAAGLKLQMIDFHGTALDIWSNVIDQADKQNKVTHLVNAVLVKYPENPYLKSALTDTNYSLSLNIDKTTEWNPIEEETLELLTLGVNTLLPIRFLKKGIKASRAVAKIEIKNEVGTGFIFKVQEIDELFFMTNYHVIKDKNRIRQARIIFNYEEDINGETERSRSFNIDANGPWYTSPINEFDVIIFKLEASLSEIAEFGYLELKKVEIEKNDFVNIIQHPGGGMKQISLYHNIVTSAENRAIQYLTDTMKGSSGAPVFNSNWEVVALHHSGGVRKSGEDTLGAKYRNEGININRIIEFLLSNHK